MLLPSLSEHETATNIAIAVFENKHFDSTKNYLAFLVHQYYSRKLNIYIFALEYCIHIDQPSDVFIVDQFVLLDDTLLLFQL